ncbi:acyl-CoA dehydrogenase family protein [Leisingera thetidis]|uniref:acyl-CoA dehydrogenase family protein n=1 Tax=Leisingera thetidis TaxID=2930199 RepID=UPI0021F7CCD5|nr:acyl-CoA dehydrogenase family protein [Leisingera thetidis]
MALDLSASAKIIQPAQSGRAGSLAAALAALGQAAYGLDGCPACQGAAICAPGLPVLGADARPVAPAALAAVADPVLDALHLQLVQVDGTCAAAEDVAVPALMLRAGLLGRILDLAHAHLKGRASMGRKTLSHQLVKVGFADAYGTLRLISETAQLRAESGDMAGLAEDHARLTAATIEAEKLMGGHGYLIGGTHPIGYLSMLLHVIYGPRQ